MKAPSTITCTALLGAIMFFSPVSPADARVGCAYTATDINGHVVAGYGSHRKKFGVACDRARRKCNRRMDRERRKKRFGRSHGCKRVN